MREEASRLLFLEPEKERSRRLIQGKRKKKNASLQALCNTTVRSAGTFSLTFFREGFLHLSFMPTKFERQKALTEIIRLVTRPQRLQHAPRLTGNS
jgi:hypothetical protein